VDNQDGGGFSIFVDGAVAAVTNASTVTGEQFSGIKGHGQVAVTAGQVVKLRNESGGTVTTQTATSEPFNYVTFRVIPHTINAGDAAIGVNQSWQNVLGSRSSGVTYTNTTGKPIQVAVEAISSTTTGHNVAITFEVSGLAVAESNSQSSGNSVSANTFIIVPAGSTYEATISGTGSPSLNKWMELR
jgi:hypothetical protein